MKNIIINQSIYTATCTEYNDNHGMQDGYFRTRYLIKVFKNNVIEAEFTRESKKAWICIAEGIDSVSISCKSSEKAIRSSWMWRNRKDESQKSILIPLN